MEKFIPYEKRSKKKQREQNNSRRGSWGVLKPVTRKPENSKAYQRQKARKWRSETPKAVPSFFLPFLAFVIKARSVYYFK